MMIKTLKYLLLTSVIVSSSYGSELTSTTQDSNPSPSHEASPSSHTLTSLVTTDAERSAELNSADDTTDLLNPSKESSVNDDWDTISVNL